MHAQHYVYRGGDVNPNTLSLSECFGDGSSVIYLTARICGGGLFGSRKHLFGLVGPKPHHHNHQTVTTATATTTATHQAVTISQNSPGQQNVNPSPPPSHVCVAMDHGAGLFGMGGGAQASVQINLCRICQARMN